MEPKSHLNLIAMALLQTCSYVTDQMQSQVSIDVNKFLSSFSLQAEGSQVHPPLWTENNSLTPNETSTSSTPFFDMDDYRSLCQQEAVHWINLQQRRSSIIPRLRPTTEDRYDQLRKAVTSEKDPLYRLIKKQGNNIYTKPLRYIYIVLL
jgi:hypothetical protein